jgi:hypothetical protein
MTRTADKSAAGCAAWLPGTKQSVVGHLAENFYGASWRIQNLLALPMGSGHER